MNRYAVTVSYYEYADDDEMVVRLARQFTKEMDKRKDNKAVIVEIVHRDFGEMKGRKIDHLNPDL